MTEDLVERLRSWSEGDACLAPVSTKEMIDSAADRIEQLENVLQEIAGIANIPETPPTKIGAETDIMWGCLVMCTFMARGAMGELDEQ